MNIMMIGFGMALVPMIVAMFVAVGMLFHLMYEATTEVYRGRNVMGFLAMLLGWSLVIGLTLLIGNVMVSCWR